MAGLLFCLASTRCRAFILPCCNIAKCKRLQRVLRRQCSYTTQAIKQRTELYRRFSCDCARSSAHDTRPTQAAIYHLRHAGAHHNNRTHSSTYQIPPPPRALHRSAHLPYYNKVYKGAGVRPCYRFMSDDATTMQYTANHTSPAARDLAPVSSQGAPGQPGTLHPAGQSGSRARRAARNH